MALEIFRHRKPSYDQLHRVASTDGWPIAVYEYKPSPTAERQPFPVVCCHGTNCRYAIFDGGDGFGLAPWLAERGFHVFALDLRGRGLSAPRSLSGRLGALVRKGWTLGDFLGKDLPATFEFVLKKSGAKQLDLIGHSMGGMLGLELLARTQDVRVRRLVTVGSGDAPAMLLPADKQGEQAPQGPDGAGATAKNVSVGLMLAPFALTMRYTPIHWGGRFGAIMMPLADERMMEKVIEPMLGALVNPRNIDQPILRYFIWNGLAGISARKFWSFGAMYRKFLKEGVPPQRHHHPTLMFSGSEDRLVSPEKVSQTASRCSHPESKVVECGREHDCLEEYGHMDLLLGRNVEREVFPHIRTWLQTAVAGKQRAAG